MTEVLGTGWEPEAPVDDSLARRFVFAYAEMARRTGGRVLDVDWVAVLPQARGRGYGGAVTSAALAVAPELPAMLISSDDGHPVYRRLGFWDLFRATMWEHPPR